MALELYSELIGSLQALPAEPSGEEFLRALQAWLQRRIAKWRPEHRSRWGLDDYVGMDLSRYPIDTSSLNPSEELRQLRAVPPSSMDVFAMRLRDILWEGVTVESPVVCPR